MIVKLLPEMTLAFSYAEGIEGRKIAVTEVNRFLETINQAPNATKKYFYQVKVSHGNHDHLTHLVYAVVPTDTKGMEKITIVKLSAGEYLNFTISKREFEDPSNGAENKIAEAAAIWLKENHKKFDMRQVMGLIEEVFIDGYDIYNIYFPIK